MSIVIMLVAAAAAVTIDNTGEALSGLVLFYVFLTTAMVFGVVSSYFVDLYPTSYRFVTSSLKFVHSSFVKSLKYCCKRNNYIWFLF